MTDDPSPQPEDVDPAHPSGDVEPDWVRRKRLASVFGDVLPEQTSDDTAPAADGGGKGDEWYQDQVPPHHG